jgi:threonine dehydratase
MTADAAPLALWQVLEARRLLAGVLPRTPLYHSPGLSALCGTEVHVKYENHSPTGSFKARGALAALSKAAVAAERAGRPLAGAVTSSTGNHGLGVAFAGRRLRLPVTVYVPRGANPDKCRLIEQAGARIVATGRDLDEAKTAARRAAAGAGMAFVDDGDDPWLLAGAGTVGVEILEDLPVVDALLFPAGGGALLAGAGLAAKRLKPEVTVIGVTAERAPGVYLSWRAGGRPVTAPHCDTFAEGLAQPTPAPLAARLVAEVADDVVLVSEAALKQAVRLTLAHTHQLAEGAGAAALAGALQQRSALAGKTVAVVLSGGIITPEVLLDVLRSEAP